MFLSKEQGPGDRSEIRAHTYQTVDPNLILAFHGLLSTLCVGLAQDHKGDPDILTYPHLHGTKGPS